MKIDGLRLDKLSCIEFCFASNLCSYFSVDFLSQLKHNKHNRYMFGLVGELYFLKNRHAIKIIIKEIYAFFVIIGYTKTNILFILELHVLRVHASQRITILSRFFFSKLTILRLPAKSFESSCFLCLEHYLIRST